MKFTKNRVMYGSIVLVLVLGASACNDNAGADKTNDSLSTAPSVAKPADSTRVAMAKRKMKGQTSVSEFTTETAKMVKDVHGVYNKAEKEPEFPGGQTALANYINNNIAYPQSAVDNGTRGTVQVSFIVDEHGKVLTPRVINGTQLGDGLADEALTAFNKMPSWTPGTVHGKNVKTRMVLPVKFELEDAD
jgi:periplasmic protein TonB